MSTTKELCAGCGRAVRIPDEDHEIVACLLGRHDIRPKLPAAIAAVMKLKQGAMQAEELFGLDELEQFAEEQRQKGLI